jgi:hypothetical protein
MRNSYKNETELLEVHAAISEGGERTAGNNQLLRADPKGGPIAKNHAFGPKG